MNVIVVPLLRGLNHACVIGRLQNTVILYHATSEAESSLTNSVTVGYFAGARPTSVLVRQKLLACSHRLLETFTDCSRFSSHVRKLTAYLV
jgi:hypothetical protein